MSAVLETTDEMLTTEKAAKLLDIEPRTLEKWRETNRYGLKYVRVGRLIKYRRSDVETWMEQRTEGATAN